MLRLLTIRLPFPRNGSSARVTRKVPCRLVSITSRQVAIVERGDGLAGPAMPALLMSTSRRLRRPTISASLATDCGSRTSQTTAVEFGSRAARRVQRATVARGEDQMKSACGERLGNGKAKAARGSSDNGMPDGSLARAGMLKRVAEIRGSRARWVFSGAAGRGIRCASPAGGRRRAWPR